MIQLSLRAPREQRKTRFLFSVWLVSGALLAGSPSVQALPTQGAVSVGSAIMTSESSQLSIRQSSPSVVIDWKTFSVGPGETVQFLQPSALSMAVNRVFGGDPSVIAGQITANGRVVLINGSGILFSSTSRVDVGGLIASTLNLANSDFSTGQLFLEGNGSAAVINRGKINVPEAGVIAFVGPQVKNFGEINAPGARLRY